MTLRTAVRRIGHGSFHMHPRSLLLRVSVVLIATVTALVTSDPLLGLITSIFASGAGTAALWELYDIAVECEDQDNEDQDDDEDETGFGMAA